MTLLRALFARNEFLAGLLVTVLGFGCLAAVGDLDIGTAVEMGPGYVPRALAWTLVLAGLVMALLGARSAAPVRPAMAWRPLLAVSASMVVFGLLVDRGGLVLAVTLSTVVGTLASPITRHRETPWLVLGLVLLATLVFAWGMGLAIPIWPR